MILLFILGTVLGYSALMFYVLYNVNDQNTIKFVKTIKERLERKSNTVNEAYTTR
jgi:hypothetical protein